MAALIDSSLTKEEALKQNPDSICPEHILKQQKLIEVFYYSLDSKLHKGQVVINKALTEDVKDAFGLTEKIKFPITSAIPMADPKFHWDDQLSIKANNTSGFNYRKIQKTNKLSNHSYGYAIDINPLLNPYFRDDWISPKGARYDPSKPGTITAGDPIVLFFEGRGWDWGGNWEDRKDYQHFEKRV